MSSISRAVGGLLLLAAATSAGAADPAPERPRPPGTPQAVGALHTLRQIPEACARLEGMFTGQAAEPYRFSVVPSSPGCQPRARYVDYLQAEPAVASGWKLNDVIRVPNAGCPSQQAVVRVWRLPADNQPPQLDGQGQARIYLEEAKQQAASGKVPKVALFSAQMTLEGKACP